MSYNPHIRHLFCLLVLLLFGRAAPALEIPQLDTLTLNNGLKVFLLQQDEGADLNIRLVINGGKKNETACQVGYSEIIQRLLSEALKDQFSCAIRQGQTIITSNCSVAGLNKKMELLSIALSRLAFTQSGMDRAVASIRDTYRMENMSSAFLAAVYGNLILYGIQHPLGRAYCQYQVEKVIPEQLRDFYLEHYLPKGSFLVVCGNLNVYATRKTIAKHFVRWRLLRKPDHLAPDLALPVPKFKGQQVAFVNQREMKQCLLKWLQPAPAFNSPDHLPFMLACRLFDGHMSRQLQQLEGEGQDSLLFNPLGYTNGFMEANAQASRDQMIRAKQLFDTALHRFRQVKFTEVDVETAKEQLKNTYLQLNGPESLASFYDPLAYDFNDRRNYLANVAAIRLPDLHAVLKKYFNPDAYKLIIVGSEQALKSQLDTLKNISRHQAWEFETCDEACKEIVILKCHCESCYRRGQCYTWRFDPSRKDAIKNAKARAK